jgi:excisionase family DNA binding protein
METPGAPNAGNGKRSAAPAVNPIAYQPNTAAAACGETRTKIYEALKTGALKAKKSGRRTLIPAECLREYIASLPDYPSKAA